MQRTIVIKVSLIVTLSASVILGTNLKNVQTIVQIIATTPTSPIELDYERLKIDMSLIEARSILGQDQEIFKSSQKSIHIWKYNESKIIGIFQNQKLIEKRIEWK